MQDLLFRTAAIRLAGSLPLQSSAKLNYKFSFSNFAIVIAKLSQVTFNGQTLDFKFEVTNLGETTFMEMRVPWDDQFIAYNDLAIIGAFSLKT